MLKQEKPIIVTKIVLVYNIDELIELEEKLDDIVAEKQKALTANKMDFEDEKIKEIDEKIEDTEKEIHESTIDI